tara:strand:- start:429 stop:1082 length:654 start_codon:yes stop_codon:yes gene_type:complete
MGYLDNDTIVVDAILTKHGRKLLADGDAINPNFFALSDDGVDYNLWNSSSPSGSDGYDDYITKLPMVEAVPDDSVMMKYYLLSLNQNTRYMPVVKIYNAPNTDYKYTLDNDASRDAVRIEPEILNWSQPNPRFDFHFTDVSAINITGHDGQVLDTSGAGNYPLEREIPSSLTILNSTFVAVEDLAVTKDVNVTVLIQHVESGAPLTVTLQILKSSSV